MIGLNGFRINRPMQCRSNTPGVGSTKITEMIMWDSRHFEQYPTSIFNTESASQPVNQRALDGTNV
jgi:hypothetical protein